MLSKKLASALNAQLTAELYSAYLYLSMAAMFRARSLHGLGHWMETQAREETGHAMRFYKHLLERGNAVKLPAIEAPPSDWASPLAAFQDTYAHEQQVTGRIHELANLATAEKDHATAAFLRPFIEEQVEEEATAFEMVQKLNLVGNSAGGLLVLDHHAGKRDEAKGL